MDPVSCLPKTFKGLVDNNLAINFTFEGVEYNIAELSFPDGKKIVFGLNGAYRVQSPFLIIKALENSLFNCCLADLGLNGKNRRMVFKYQTISGQKFLIIREQHDPALTKEEIKLFWNLLQ